MGLVNYTKEFGAKSKILGAVSPGAWHAKEAAKFMYDKEADYKRDRSKYALRGVLAPGTSAYIHAKAAQMHEDGKSAAEIHDWIEKNTNKHAALAVGETILPVKTAASAMGRGLGLAQKVTGKGRKKFEQ